MSSSNRYKYDSDQRGPTFGVRHIQVFLVFLTVTVGYLIRSTLSIAIISMTTKSNNTNIQTFDWSSEIQGSVLSSFFWGYTLMQIPGGYMAQKYGVKILITTAMFVNGISNICIPWIVGYGGWIAICGCRIIQGLSQAPLFPCVSVFISKWVPDNERSRLGNILYGGITVGIIIGMPLSSTLISTSIGWPCVFYVSGILCIITGILLSIYFVNTPQNHKLVTLQELKYIESSLGTHRKVYDTPWKSIFTSIPILSFFIGQTAYIWSTTLFFTKIPSFYSGVLGIDLKTGGFITSIPYVFNFIISILLSYLSDYLVNSQIIKVTTSRKLFCTIGLSSSGVGIIMLRFFSVGHEYFSIGIVSFCLAAISGCLMGPQMNFVDLAPNFSGILQGMGNVFAYAFGNFAPMLCGFIIKDETDIGQWGIIFYITAAIHLFCNVFYLVFGTSSKQSWNEPNCRTNSDHESVQEEMTTFDMDEK